MGRGIEEIDKNFAAEQVRYDGMTTYHLPCAPFEIRGLYRAAPGDYRRLPHEVARQCNESLQQMYLCPSGGRIRFRTDSGRVILKSVQPDLKAYPHQPLTGSHCFDLYADGVYINAFRPDTSAAGAHVSRADFSVSQGYDAMISLGERKMREIEIGFPLYSPVSDVYVALESDASLLPPTPYAVEKPFVIYGTSVTQGGCVSHPGINYPALLSRWLNLDFINLGFSNGGQREQEVAAYIAGLPMCALVIDSDANATGPEALAATYEPFFRTIRAAQPDLPVIFACMLGRFHQEAPVRRKIVRDVYKKVRAEGDAHVWFLDESEAIAPWGGADTCTVDGLHANDMGSYLVAKALEPILRQAVQTGKSGR